MRGNAEKKLIIFVTSLDPHPYINVIAYHTDYSSVDHIQFVSVIEGNRAVTAAADIMASVRSTISSIAQGTYAPGTAMPKDREVRLRYAGLVDKLSTIIFSDANWHRNELDAHLRQSIASSTIFDVTAVKNDLLVEIATLLISLNHPRASSFELLRPPNHDYRDLYYFLGTDEFRCKNLLDGPNIARALRRTAFRQVNRRLLLAAACTVLLLVVFTNYLWPQSIGANFLNAVATAASITGVVTLVNPRPS